MLGTLGTAVNEAYLALFSMGAHVIGMTPFAFFTRMARLSSNVLKHFAFWMLEVVVRNW